MSFGLERNSEKSVASMWNVNLKTHVGAKIWKVEQVSFFVFLYDYKEININIYQF